MKKKKMNKKIHFSLSITILVKIVALHFLLYICSFDFDFVKQIAFTEVFSFRLFCFQIHPFLKKRKKKKKAREDVICKVFLIGWQVNWVSETDMNRCVICFRKNCVAP